MKLLHYAYRKLAVFLFLLMTVWGVLFYCTIVNEVMDETDDTLQNYAHILINSALYDPAVLDTDGGLMSRYSFRPISEEEWKHYGEAFYDSTLYIELEDEYEPVRVMRTAFRMPDERFYEVTLMISTLERDDMVRATVWYLAALFLLFLLVTSIGIRMVLRGVFKPLSHLLAWLHGITPGKPVPPLDNPSQIREFQLLSKAAYDMGNRSFRAYREQKQFIENASHELQTPLAIARGKVELLAESETLGPAQMKELDAIYSTLGRAVKLNKSLLLLSRIENGQYAEAEEVNVDDVLDNLLPDLFDIYEHKQIRVERRRGAKPFVIRCNLALAQILVSNLAKNALVHTPQEGELHVVTTPSSLEMKNTGDAALPADEIFRRFYHRSGGQEESTGLGLPIARTIARSFALELTYHWEAGLHCFSLVKKR